MHTTKIPNLVDLTCQEVTELITDYMSGAMGEVDRGRFEQHLHACTWCMTYLSQMRRTVSLARQLAESEPDDDASVEIKLAQLFRQWKGEQE